MKQFLFIVVSIFLLWACSTTQKKVTMAELESQLSELQNANAYSNSKLEELSSRLFAIHEEVEANRLAVEEYKSRKFVMADKTPKKKQEVTLGTGDPANDFGQGFRYFQNKNYNKALISFRAFLKRYPKHKLVPETLYWMGEIYFDRKHYKTAIQHFKRIPEEFPATKKIDSAILKLGFCFLKLGQKEAARAKFQEIIDIYPHSNSVIIAKKQIAEIK